MMLTKDISYSVNGKIVTGYLADDEMAGTSRPGVLVCHQGGGLTEHAKERARMLAELGYVAFALDMYGEPVTGMEHAMGLLRGLMQDPALMRARANAALDLLKKQANVDPKRLAAVGYSFGGAVVLEIARSLRREIALFCGSDGLRTHAHVRAPRRGPQRRRGRCVAPLACSTPS